MTDKAFFVLRAALELARARGVDERLARAIVLKELSKGSSPAWALSRLLKAIREARPIPP
jgi:hypothetical protein